MKFDNKYRLSICLEILLDGLSSYMEKQIKAHYKDEWWEKGIIRSLETASKDKQLKNGETLQNYWNDPELSQLFHVMIYWENWNPIFSIDIGKNKKDMVINLRDIRNKNAHRKSVDAYFNNENTTRNLDSMIEFLKIIGKHDEADKIRVLKNKNFKNIPFSRNSTFIGREDLLIEIHEKLFQNDGQNKSNIYLTGIPGVGKTKIAYEYAYRYLDYYTDGIFWINSTISFESEFVKVARDFISGILGERDFKDNEAIKKFSDYIFDNNKTLIIIDGLEELGTIDKQIMGEIPNNLSGHMIITSRKLTSKSPQKTIDVTGLSPDAAINLLLSGSSHRDALINQSQDSAIIQNAQAICASFGYHPLAICVASAYLEQFPEISCKELLHRIKKEGPYNTLVESDSDPSHQIAQYESSIKNMFTFQWDALGNPKSKLTLQIMSVFDDLLNVPRSLIASLAGIEDDKNKRIGASTPFDLVLVEIKKFRFVESQDIGKTCFSLSYDNEYENEFPLNISEPKHEKRYTIHPLIRDFITHTIVDERVFIDHLITTFIEVIRNPEKLNESIISNGIDKTIEEIQSVNGLLRKSPNQWIDIDSSLYYYLSLLKQESHNLRSWNMMDLHIILNYSPQWFNPKDLPGFAIQQIFNRLLTSQNNRDANEYLNYLKNLRLPALCEQSKIESDSIILERTLIGHNEHIGDMVISQDNQYLISSSEDGTIIEWDINSGKAINQTIRLENWPLFTGVNSENQRVISNHENWKKWADNEVFWGELNTDDPDTIKNDIANHSMDDLAASLDDFGSIFIWNTKDGKLITKLEIEPDFYVYPDPSSLFFSIENDRLIYQNFKGVICWDMKNWSRVFLFKSGKDAIIYNSALDSIYKVLLIGDKTGNLSWIDIETGAVSQIENAHEGFITNILIHPCEEKIITSSVDGNIKVWNWVDGALYLDMCFGFANNSINDIAITAQGTTLISGHDNGTVVLWDLITGNQIKTLYGQGNPVTQVIISSDDQKAFSKSEDWTIKIWDLNKINEESDDDANIPGLFRIVLSKNSRYGIGIGNNIAVLYDLDTNLEKSRIILEDEEINGMVFSEDDSFAIIFGRNVYNWNYLKEDTTQTMIFNDDCNRSFIYVTPNKKWILSKRVNCDQIVNDGEHPQDTIEVWNLEKDDILYTLTVEPHSNRSFFIDESGNNIIAKINFPINQNDLEKELPGIEYWTIDETATTSLINHQVPYGKALISADWNWFLIDKADRMKEIRNLISDDLLSSLSYGYSDLSAKFIEVSQDTYFASIIFSDGSIQLWNLKESHCKAVLPGSFIQCSFTADSSKLVAVDSMGQLHFLESLNCKD